MAGFGNHKKIEQSERDARRLSYLFRGRFDENTAARLIEDKGGVDKATDFIMKGNEEDVQDFLNKDPDYVKNLRRDSEKVGSLLENVVEWEDRQFSCEGCQRSWWKRVPARKEVARCDKCKKKYDPIPRDKEWGWGKFICDGCNRNFRGIGIMGATKSKCHGCGSLVLIHEILPPKKEDGDLHNKASKKDTHNCNGINCYRQVKEEDGYQGAAYSGAGGAYPDPHGWQLVRGRSQKKIKPIECIHPRSQDVNSRMKKRIYYASKEHVSTGSTVCTFLSSGSLDTTDKSIANSLETIWE